MRAYHLMNRDIVAVLPDTSIQEMMTLFDRHHFSNLPVVDADDHVVGLVNHFYLTAYADILAGGVMPDGTAADVMQTDVICIHEDDEISDVAWTVARSGADMLAVVRDGRLVGVVSRTDLIRLYALAG